jgi:hypothetical protein
MLSPEEKAEREKRIGKLGIKYTTTQDKKPYVFVSYKSDDWEEVMEEIIYPLQKEYGLRVYYDQAFDYESNDYWCDQMKKNMRSIYCRAVLCFISQKYIASYATLMEVLYSHVKEVMDQHGKKPLELVPIILPSCNTGDMDKLSEDVCSEDEIPLKLRTKECEEYTKFLSKIKESKSLESIWIERAQELAEKEKSLTNHDVAIAFCELLGEGQQIEKYRDNQDEYINKIKRTIQGAVSKGSDDPKWNVFDEELKESFSTKDIKEEKSLETTTRATKKREVSKPEPPVMQPEVSVAKPEKPVKKAKPAVSPAPSADPAAVKVTLTPNTTLKQLDQELEDVGHSMYMREIRDNKELFSKQFFDYVMAAALRGCDQKAEAHSGRWNYCRCAVAKDVNLDPSFTSASQFTWSSNSRKAVNIEGSGKLGQYSQYFESLPETMTLGELRKAFASRKDPAFETRDNDAVDHVFDVLFQ